MLLFHKYLLSTYSIINIVADVLYVYHGVNSWKKEAWVEMELESSWVRENKVDISSLAHGIFIMDVN